MHYKRFVRNGDPNVVRQDKSGGVCGIDGCDNPNYALRLCKEHYITDPRTRSRQNELRRMPEARERNRLNRLSDTQRHLSTNLRNRLNQAIKGGQKSGSAVRDLGCSIPHFKLYIENQFQDGMSWENYGEWHLDHVLPLAKYDLTDRSEFLEAANWLNYQPLWASENLSKGVN